MTWNPIHPKERAVSLLTPLLVALLLGAVPRLGPAQGAGAVDPSFNPVFRRAGQVRDVAVQPDGKILIVGDFTHVESVPRPGIARLLPDGSLDVGFDPPDLRNVGMSSLSVIRPLAGGKVLVGTDRPTRLNTDGSLDITFDDDVFFFQVEDAAELPDGRTLVSGFIPGWWGGVVRYETDGSLVGAFAIGADQQVNAIAPLPDGKLLVGGNFSYIGGVARSRIARVSAEWSVDESFAPQIDGAYPTVHSVCALSDGSYAVAGNFTSVNGVPRNGLVRLFADGSVDPSFDPGATLDGGVSRVYAAPGNRILVIGAFGTIGGVARSHVARLLLDGTVDPSFDPGPGPDSWLSSSRVLQDGSVFVAGQLTYYTNSPRFGLAKATSTGSLDSGFSAMLSRPAAINSLLRLDDGRLIVGGLFGSVNGEAQSAVARLNADGSRDATFGPLARSTGEVLTLALQADGKVVAGGDFTQVCGAKRARIARLNSDGSLDGGFDPGTGADQRVTGVGIREDGKALAAGWFNNFGGSNRAGLVQLRTNGMIDLLFPPASSQGGVRTVLPQPGGQSIIGGAFTTFGGTPSERLARLAPDGTFDPSFGLSGSGGVNGSINVVVGESDGHLLIGGTFSAVQGVTRSLVARLSANGLLDPAFAIPESSGEVKALAGTADSKVVVGGAVKRFGNAQRNGIARLVSDGSLDPTFHAGTGVDTEVRALAVEPSGAVFVAGDFRTLNGQPRTGLARLLATTRGGSDLTVRIAGSGSGSVYCEVATTSCQGMCTFGIPAGTVSTVTASTGAGSVFVGWTGDCTGTGVCELTGDQPHTVVATFAHYPLEASGMESVDEVPGCATIDCEPGPWDYSDLNGVLEPGESVAVSPRWQNVGHETDEFTGHATSIVGPPGTGPYGVSSTSVYYGEVVPGSSSSCRELGGLCYTVTMPPLAQRPASHLDATLTEVLDSGATKKWTLHIGDSFADVPRSHFAYRFVETLLHSGLTAGCSATQFCPASPVTRWQMAVFLATAMTDGNVPTSGTVPTLGDYDCRPGGTTLFDDVPPDDGGCRFVHYLAREGVTAGCDTRAYCPNDSATRWQTAVLLASALAGASIPAAGTVPGLGDYDCQPGGTTVFDDVPPEDAGCRFVHYLAAEGITAGCDQRAFCPTNLLARAEAAVFLVSAYDYSLY